MQPITPGWPIRRNVGNDLTMVFAPFCEYRVEHFWPKKDMDPSAYSVRSAPASGIGLYLAFARTCRACQI